MTVIHHLHSGEAPGARMQAQLAYARTQYADKRLHGARRAAFHAALRLRFVLRAAVGSRERRVNSRHVLRVLAGREPWQGISVRREDVRRQLEQELMGKLIHLRQVFAAEWGNPKRLQEVVRGSRAGFLTMLRAALRLAGRTPPGDPAALVREAGALIGFPSDPLEGADPAGYLDAMTRTATYVNRMERNAP